MKEFYRHPSGSSSAVERQLPKLDVAGSIPVSRSIESQLTDEELEAFFTKSARVARNCRIRARSDSETLSNFRPIPRNPACCRQLHNPPTPCFLRSRYRL